MPGSVPETAKARKPWERQKGEGAKAFRAFMRYRDMGADRSVAKAAHVKDQPKPAKIGYYHWWKQWAAKWHWRERALAFDEYREAVRQKAADDKAVQVAIEEADENERQRKLRVQEARATRTAGAAVLARFLDLVKQHDLQNMTLRRKKTTTFSKTEDGGLVKVEDERKAITSLLPQAITAVIEGAKAERLELGDVTDRTALRIEAALVDRLAEAVKERFPREQWEDVGSELAAILRGERGNGRPG